MSSVDTTNLSTIRKKKSTRLASDVIGQLEDKIKDNPLDLDAWLELIQRVEQKDKTEQVRSVYDKFFTRFSFLSTQWINYINYELNRGEFEKVEEIFKRCLLDVSSIELWRTYVGYIRRKNNLITGGEDARKVIFQAYELAVDKVGIDPHSGSLWEEYLKFIDDWKPISKWDEQQKMDMKRKVYKKALVLPLNNLETLWSDYTSFENDLNTTTARKFISEISGNYMNARSWFKEWSNLIDGITRADDFFSPENDLLQLEKWNSWISWELLNKLELDKQNLVNRVDYVYKQAIQKLIFKPQIWFSYQQFYKDNDDLFPSSQVEQLLIKGLLVNPTSFALNFKLIEIYELDKNASLVKKTFDTLLDILLKDHEIKLQEINELKELLLEQVLIQKKVALNEDEELKPLTEEEETFIYSSNTEIQQNILLLKELSKIITLTYCQYMKTIKRLEGLSEARNIFKVCRTDKKKIITHHIFVESGYEEYYFEKKTKVALNIFELGLRPAFFGNDGEYIFKYLKFLIKINDDTNSKSLFESTINTKKNTIEPRWLKLIFKEYLKYESDFGQVASVTKIEKKFYEIFPDEEKIFLFADRYSFNEVVLDEFQADDDLIRFHDLKLKSKLPAIDSESNSKKRKASEDDDEPSKKQHVELTENGDTDDEILGGKELVTDEIYNLLRILPNANYFTQPLFNHSKLIKLLKELE